MLPSFLSGAVHLRFQTVHLSLFIRKMNKCINLIKYVSTHTNLCWAHNLATLSSADEREDQHQLLQVQSEGRLLHHAQESLVQLHEPLDQRGGVHRLHQHCRLVSPGALRYTPVYSCHNMHHRTMYYCSCCITCSDTNITPLACNFYCLNALLFCSCNWLEI